MFLSAIVFVSLLSSFEGSPVRRQSPPSCQIPPKITIRYAEDPCWTFEWIKTQYREAEQDVGFSRWLTDKPYTPNSFENLSLQVVEHPNVFSVGGIVSIGVFKIGGLHVIGPNQIEYSKKHALIYPNLIMRHELGHMRELEEEIKWSLNDAFLTYGWWHFGHGDFLDPLVQTMNFVTRWFYRDLPESYSYWPGLIGHPPDKGSPGANLSEELPPNTNQAIFFNSLEENYKVAACIISLPKN